MSTLLSLSSQEAQSLTKIFDQYITSKTAGALSTLLSEPIDHNVQIFCMANIQNIRLDPDEINMCAVRLNGKGDTHIEILYTIQQKHARKIAAKLLCVNDICEIDEMGASAIQEVANIMTGSFFNALSNGTGFRVDLSTPNYANAEFQSLIDVSLKDVVKQVEYAVIADVELTGKSTGAKLHMIIMQNSDDARKLLLNHSDKSNTNGENSTPVQEDTSYPVGGSNSEIDALLSDILQEKQ
ncbi:MAG: chemotaxis protein CheC [Nitrososphaerota archaeon]